MIISHNTKYSLKLLKPSKKSVISTAIALFASFFYEKTLTAGLIPVSGLDHYRGFPLSYIKVAYHYGEVYWNETTLIFLGLFIDVIFWYAISILAIFFIGFLKSRPKD
ncbi:MAG: hypothetical protein COT26_00255 [Candidatus Kerfeldbacteria bacterium CG08_land_8_20_14_0_20_43_14]|uniref:Uncharacterized protein n=1 Tax=Candidatus Kerfeldbacteria bacterium CG08_land_8_20_14_0_20_43_14 TaxID=2014246 RepID=A0A2H0YRW2_9BACT|nr:MAG: hypothetical protein COT26_00255 [Candidatus Kerfeldbacteria bacterium CG08_land_8_20_14_0_20_43_14]